MKTEREFAAIILAAGKGTRMKSTLHKVLHPIAGRPMLMHLLDSLAELEFQRTVVVVGDKREQLDAALAKRATDFRSKHNMRPAPLGPSPRRTVGTHCRLRTLLLHCLR